MFDIQIIKQPILDENIARFFYASSTRLTVYCDDTEIYEKYWKLYFLFLHITFGVTTYYNTGLKEIILIIGQAIGIDGKLNE